MPYSKSFPKVCIVILCYNTLSKLGEKFIHEVIKSISLQNYKFFKVIVVDNGSTDDTHLVFERELKNTELVGSVIHLKNNYGWSGGNNRGAVLCRDSDYIFFLNDDIILIDRNVIKNLVDFMEKHKDVGAVQPVIINRDGSFNYGYKLAISGFGTDLFQPIQPSFLCGAALFTRTTIFFEIGMFDEDFFLYHDDVDFSLRLWLAGYKVSTVQKAKVFHVGGVSVGDKLWYYIIRNNFMVIGKISDNMYLINKIVLSLIEILISWLWFAVYRLKDSRKIKFVIKGLIQGITLYLAKGILKRRNVIRRVNERSLIKKGVYDTRLDLQRILPIMNKIFPRQKSITYLK